MKPEDVRAALLRCISRDGQCNENNRFCPYYNKTTTYSECKRMLLNDALALLDEKDAEVERLMREKTALECIVTTARNQGRAEAAKEKSET